MNTDALTPIDVRSTFHLRLGPLAVGTLTVEDGRWTFRYADEFRRRNDATPLPVFPDLDETYVSDELFPFFRMRVPSLKRKAIREIVANDGLDPNDQVELLRRFGRRTISNPFELIEDVDVPGNAIVVGRPRARPHAFMPTIKKTRVGMPPLPASTYEITTKTGRHVMARLFKSADDLCAEIRSLPEGAYHVFRVIGADERGTRETEFWGEITNHGSDIVSYASSSSND